MTHFAVTMCLDVHAFSPPDAGVHQEEVFPIENITTRCLRRLGAFILVCSLGRGNRGLHGTRMLESETGFARPARAGVSPLAMVAFSVSFLVRSINQPCTFLFLRARTAYLLKYLVGMEICCLRESLLRGSSRKRIVGYVNIYPCFAALRGF